MVRTTKIERMVQRVRGQVMVNSVQESYLNVLLKDIETVANSDTVASVPVPLFELRNANLVASSD